LRVIKRVLIFLQRLRRLVEQVHATPNSVLIPASIVFEHDVSQTLLHEDVRAHEVEEASGVEIGSHTTDLLRVLAHPRLQRVLRLLSKRVLLEVVDDGDVVEDVRVLAVLDDMPIFANPVLHLLRRI